MKELSLSICALAGAIMAGIGTLSENLEGARRFNNLDTIGTWIAIVCVVFTIVLAFKKSRS